MQILPIFLPVCGFETLATEARGEGFLFLDRLKTEWQSEQNCFDAPGEVFLGAIEYAGLGFVTISDPSASHAMTLS